MKVTLREGQLVICDGLGRIYSSVQYTSANGRFRPNFLSDIYHTTLKGEPDIRPASVRIHVIAYV